MPTLSSEECYSFRASVFEHNILVRRIEKIMTNSIEQIQSLYVK